MKKNFYVIILSLLFAHTSNAQWTTICQSGDDMVISYAVYNNAVYATGFFTNMCGISARYISRWDGTQWYTVDTGLAEAGHRIEALDSGLYVAPYSGLYPGLVAPVTDSNWILKWNGTHFERVGEGVYLTTLVSGTDKIPNLYDVAQYNGNIIASGEFDVVGNRSISGIMQWNGTKWDSLGSGLSGSIDGSGIMYPHQLLAYDGSLYVVGNFSTAGGITVNGVARWDGTQWHAMGAGLNGEVYSIGVINNEIYVGGVFSNSDTATLHNIAKWNGTRWVNPGFGVVYANPVLRGYVHTIEQVGTRGVFEGGFDRLIIGNHTYNAGSVIAFDGTNVDTLGGGMPGGEFEGMTTSPFDSALLVGGAMFGNNTDTTRVAEYKFAPLGIPVINNTSFSAYPNPVTDELVVETNKSGILKAYDMIGREVYSVSLTSQRQTISMGQLSPGMYVLQLRSEDGAVGYKQIAKQ